ncbi:ImmA/IrrE family metallo-endopeptidase [Streptomyces murinus]|uniref:ImmA/IrrE family metallo-endopeptidase n=1 Tax=Streptomyces murinus TaxID=33900 RepID=UPI003F44EC29
MKRCALSHELAHIKLDHRRCAFSDDAVTSISAINQERSAEMWASRQLISAVQLAVARESGLPVLAVSKELGVTDRMYRARLLAEKQDEMRWLGAEGYGSWGCSTELVPS